MGKRVKGGGWRFNAKSEEKNRGKEKRAQEIVHQTPTRPPTPGHYEKTGGKKEVKVPKKRVRTAGRGGGGETVKDTDRLRGGRWGEGSGGQNEKDEAHGSRTKKENESDASRNSKDPEKRGRGRTKHNTKHPRKGNRKRDLTGPKSKKRSVRTEDKMGSEGGIGGAKEASRVIGRGSHQ